MSNHFDEIKLLKVKNIIYPIIIGLSVVAYFFWKDFNIDSLTQLNASKTAWWFLGLAIILMIGRDVGYILRLIILSDSKLSFRQATRVIFLWEFTSAVTPSSVGGTGPAIIYIHKEGINVGKSTAIVMLTLFLDELYFLLAFPLFILIVGPETVFNLAESGGYAHDLFTLAIISYFIKLLIVTFITYGLFIRPRGLKSIILKIFKLPFLKKWRNDAAQAGDDIIITSKDIKTKSFLFWSKAFLATILSWTSRYFVLNSIIMIFFVVPDHVLLYARQLVMWIIMLISPTPGGSGFAEYIFSRFISDFVQMDKVHIQSIVITLALLWRSISYYPYLLIGAFLFPYWIKNKFNKKKQAIATNTIE